MRVLVVNVERHLNEQAAGVDVAEAQFNHERAWPHLGINFVGTAIQEAGCEVVLWDELVQGYAPLEQLVQPGDILALSLVVTGIERGVELAYQAKRLGAARVVAGNDAAIFRANQLLRLPGKPIDAVFTSNSLGAIRQYFSSPESGESVPGVWTQPRPYDISNAPEFLQNKPAEQCGLDRASSRYPAELFVVPNFSLFPPSYWETVWSTFRRCFGHKFADPATVRNGLGLLAQGCTKIAGSCFCEYCTIFAAENVRIPPEQYFQKTAEAYARQGITHFFNVTDSSYEMRLVPQRLAAVGSPFRSMTIYGRAQGIAKKPELIEAWQRVAPERLVINIGLDSGDEEMLRCGVGKSNPATPGGSRLAENWQAVRYIKEAGANLHFSLIFGSPGETRESCQRSLEFMHGVIGHLGKRLDTLESDIFWLNFGSPAGRVFYDYGYAKSLAAKAGKDISQQEWEREFHQHSETLVVPWSAEEAWYRYFTGITVEEANDCNVQVAKAMEGVEGSIHGRAFKPFHS